jgi:hypothetical protein
MSQPDTNVFQTAAEDIPAEVAAWLARLVLLYGVPFNYLIPDEGMLPKESIRFFFLDPIWIQCLVQGACSVGNTDYVDTIIDQAMNKWLQPNQPGSNGQGSPVNHAAAGVRDRLRNQQEGIDLPEESEDLDWPLTGFLLRSAVVGGWRGLEVMAFKKEKEAVAPLKPLRIEQLSPDVMLGIFNGMIARLVIRQPQEGLHFGLTVENQSYSKILRELGYKNPKSAGELMHDKKIVLSQGDLMRDQKNRGVINLGTLAVRMKDELAASQELKDGKFTSAEFAVEMIEAPGEFTFIPQPE